MEGRIEICDSYYRWGTVCNKQWTSSHAEVVCRYFGYDDTKGIVIFPMQSTKYILYRYF